MPSSSKVIKRIIWSTVNKISLSSDCWLGIGNSSSTAIIQLKIESADSNFFMNAHTIRTLIPGMLVSTYVQHSERNKLCAAFLGSYFRDFADSGHWGEFFFVKMFLLIIHFAKERQCEFKQVSLVQSYSSLRSVVALLSMTFACFTRLCINDALISSINDAL